MALECVALNSELKAIDTNLFERDFLLTFVENLFKLFGFQPKSVSRGLFGL